MKSNKLQICNYVLKNKKKSSLKKKLQIIELKKKVTNKKKLQIKKMRDIIINGLGFSEKK